MTKTTKLNAILIAATACILFLPYFILGKNAYLLIDDNLDGEFVYFHVMKITKTLFSLDRNLPIENIMDGIPRSCLRSGTNIIGLLYYLFPSYYAYLLLNFIIRFVGFFGVYFLLKDYFLKERKEFVVPIALAFSIIPLYVLYGASVTGLPFVLWSFINILNNKKLIFSWATVILFSFFSYFIMIGPFICVLLAVIGIASWCKTKRLNFQYWFALFIMFVLFLLSEINLIFSFFDKVYISHRNAYGAVLPESVLLPIKDTISIFFSGQYHSSSFIILPVYIFAFIVLLKTKNNKTKKYIGLIFTILFVIAFFQPFYIYIRHYLGDTISIINSFAFYRFTFLIPLLWLSLFSYSILKSSFSRKIIYTFIAIQTCFILISNMELKQNIARTLNLKPKAPGFNNYFDPEIFQSIKKHINEDQSSYRIACVGFAPSIAQYNGFYTLDSYQNNYPLEYKNKFGNIIRDEIKKNDYLNSYFWGWGSRCYLFSDELEKTCDWGCYKYKNVSIQKLAINTKALKNMNGKFVFSAVRINNAVELNLAFEKSFTRQGSHWNIYVYKVI